MRLREYPAYGRTIAAHAGRGVKPICVGVLLSSDWAYFDHVPKVCIRPDEWRAGRYEFGFLGGMHVVAVPGTDCTDRQLAELLIDLMLAGPALLWAWNPDGSKLCDDDDPFNLPSWIVALTHGEIEYQVALDAERRMLAAQAPASARWLAEYERVCARSPEDAIKIYDRDQAVKKRVRALFSSPFEAPKEARAA